MKKNTEDDSKYLQSIGLRVVNLRKEKSIKQLELADLIGISDMQLRKVERGTANSTIIMLKKIATALGVTIEEMVKE